MKNSLFRYVCLVVALLICSFADTQQRANYKLAEEFHLLEQNPIIKYSTEVKSTFINGTDCFYYSFTTHRGEKYYHVSPKKKEERLLFDTTELSSKITVYTRKAYSSADPYLSLTFMKDSETIHIDFDRGLYTYNIHTKALRQLNEKPSYGNSDPYWVKYSPDSLHSLYASKDSLYFVGNQKRGQNTILVQLTTDGEPDHTFNREDEGKPGGRFGTESTHWVPGSHRFYAVREDNGKVRDLRLVSSSSTPYPTLKTYKTELAGDKHVTQYELLIGDVGTREVKRIGINRWPDQYINVLYVSKDGKRLYSQRYNRPRNQSDTYEVGVEIGKVRVVIREENKPYLDYQIRSVSFLNDGKETPFRFERSGWRHYYLYDTATGSLKSQLANGIWVTGPVTKIDIIGHKMCFYGYGRKKGIDPYYYILYEAQPDRPNAVRLLTPKDASHDVSTSPPYRYMVDSYPTVSQEPVNMVRSRNGRVIMMLEKPDLQPVYEMGWKAPERFKVKTADGVTDLYGVMWKPADFDSIKVYPIIPNVYPGPFFEYVPTRFTTNGVYNAYLAQLGFVVVTVRHKDGTPMRGKAYHTHGYNNMCDYPLADNKYAIRQPAARYPFIDAAKVGTYGHSGGGFVPAATICTYPDFYSVAASSVGNHDSHIYNKSFVEIHFGVDEKVKTTRDSLGVENTMYDYSVRVHPNQELVKNCKHSLLLFISAMDRTVNPASTLRLVNVSVETGKDFEMFVLPKCTYGFFDEFEDFFEHEIWRHFARLLLHDNSADSDVNLSRDMIKDDRRR